MTTALTSREEIERIFSSIGVDLRVDDAATPTEEDNIMDEIIDWASETIASYTLLHYDTSVLVESAWTRRRATILACYYLSQRRGNPGQFVAEAKRTMDDLQLVADHKIIIPDAIVAAADVPAISSFRVDDRYNVNKQRVVKTQSTKPYAGQQLYDLPYFAGGEYI